MRQAIVKVHNIEAGILTETADKRFRFEYHESYNGAPVSLTMPVYTEGSFLKRPKTTQAERKLIRSACIIIIENVSRLMEQLYPPMNCSGLPFSTPRGTIS
jgi:HipA N-terminal domain